MKETTSTKTITLDEPRLPQRLGRNSRARPFFCAVLMAAAFTTETYAGGGPMPLPQGPSNQVQDTTTATKPARTSNPKIQLAILLDTSGSMDGLINQIRNQLWQVVNEFSGAKQNGLTPILEVALFEYGNDGNPEDAGFVRQLTGFTRELDKVSDGLFSLTTNGGSEYCGFAIQSAVKQLQWSSYDGDIKTIFIAGNEPFTQGPVDYRAAIALATERGISVNTIFAGNYQTGIQGEWQTGALVAGGDYMSIDANQKIAHIVSPQDKSIAALNVRLNSTYVPYGNKGADKVRRQKEQDAKSGSISAGLLAKRVRAKSTSFYNNVSWDLVDAMAEGKVDAGGLERMQDADLPEKMRMMSADQRVAYVRKQTNERKEIKKQISELGRLRDNFVAEERLSQAATVPSLGSALTQSVRKQAEEKHFAFKK